MGLLVSRLNWQPLWSWLLCINLMTFLFYGLDKAAARREGRRIPERVLLAMTAFGGTPLALLAMRAFHHKTAKRSFRVWLGAIMIAQLVLVGWGVYALVQTAEVEPTEAAPQGMVPPDGHSQWSQRLSGFPLTRPNIAMAPGMFVPPLTGSAVLV